MNSLPLVQRELRAASRRWSTFLVRVIAAGAATIYRKKQVWQARADA